MQNIVLYAESIPIDLDGLKIIRIRLDGNDMVRLCALVQSVKLEGQWIEMSFHFIPPQWYSNSLTFSSIIIQPRPTG